MFLRCLLPISLGDRIIGKISSLILFSEIIDIYSDSSKRLINILYGQIMGLVNVKVCSVHNCYCTLKC
jgi:hypothetical protein